MNDTVNSDGNLFGRFVALILIAGAAFAAHRLACGSSCFMKMSCCPSSSVSTPPAPVPESPAPVEASKPKLRPKSVKPLERPIPLETALPPQTPAE
ncbi:MAG: hypothetical protein A2506_02655 [Elusimicrobia bacterium RIFOXYD12_FULL_66_9]|nr:MAG: hypothetical protein A2506_02655 [Elusimicrobia bacterium RIFOXYD12_FULL_66_9]